MLYRHLVPNALASDFPVTITGAGSAGGFPTYKAYTNSTTLVGANPSSMDVNSKYIIVNSKGMTSGTSAQKNYQWPAKKSWVFIFELNADGTLISSNRTDIYTLSNNSQVWVVTDGVSANPVNTDTFAISQIYGMEQLNVFSYYATASTGAVDGLIMYKSGASWISVSSGVAWKYAPKWDNTGNYVAGVTSNNTISLIKWGGTSITNTFSIATSLVITDLLWLGDDHLIVSSKNDGSTGVIANSPSLFSIYQRVGDTLVLLAEKIILNTEGSFASDMVATSSNRFCVAMSKVSASTTAILNVTYDGSTGLSSSIVLGLSDSTSFAWTPKYNRTICYPVGQNPSTGAGNIFTGSIDYSFELFSANTPAKKVGTTTVINDFVSAKAHVSSKKLMILGYGGVTIFK